MQKRIIGSGNVPVDTDAYWSSGFNDGRIQKALNKLKSIFFLYRFMNLDHPYLKLILDTFDIKTPAKLYRKAKLETIKTGIKVFINVHNLGIFSQILSSPVNIKIAYLLYKGLLQK